MQCQRLVGVNISSDSDEERKICETCPLMTCIYDHPLKKRLTASAITERFAQCTHCSATETLFFQDGILLTSLRWHQTNKNIVHTCGEAKLFPPSNTSL